MKKLFLILLMIVLVVALVSGGCAKPAPAPPTPAPPTPAPPAPGPEQPRYGGTLKIISVISGQGTIGWPPDMNPFSADVIFPCIDRYVNIDYKGNILPELATAWKIAEDGKSVTLTLRQGVKFHDGTDFNAEAAKWNLDYWMKAHQGGTETWTSVEVLDPYTVRINLTEYKSSVLSGLSEDYCGPVSPTAFEQHDLKWMKMNPVGTGPFKLVSIEPGVGWKYVRNDDWWGGKPYLDAIEWTVVPDENTQSMMIEKGDADMIVLHGASSAMSPQLRDKGFTLMSFLSGGDIHCMMPDSNNPDSPWAKKEVRLAADYALDKKAIALLGNGLWEPIWQIAAKWQDVYNSARERPYDPGKAKQLLADAGYPNGFETTVYVDQTTSTDLATAIQANFKDVGINAKVEVIATPLMFQKAMQGWQNSLLNAPFQQYPNFVQGLEKYFSKTSIFFTSILRAPELQEMIDNGLRARTVEEQNVLNNKAVEYIYEEALVIPVVELSYGGCGVKASYVHDDGYGIKNPSTWTPAKCWLSK